MLIDSHCHVSGQAFEEDRAQVLERARDAGLTALLDVGCDLATSRASVELAQAEPLVWAAVGVHPHEARHWDATKDEVRELAGRPRVVAWGETGLDFHYDHSPREDQRRAFREQVELALELDLPLILHVREAYPEALQLLAGYAGEPRLRGVAHCFTGSAAEAAGFVAAGFAVSFSGVVTFKNAASIREAAGVVPLELLLVETDSPYMAPVPVRGRRCEPAFVVHTAEHLAAQRGLPAAELFRATSANAARLFGLPSAGR